LARDEYFAASFFSHITKDQFESVKKNFATKGKYAQYFEGDVKYDEFKKRVDRSMSLQDIRIDSATALQYVSQRLSPAAMEAYSKCLENDPSVLGLNIWLAKPPQGGYYTLKARWVGGESESGKLTSKVEDGVRIISELPENWSRAFSYELTVKKENCSTNGAIILKVNNSSKDYILIGDAPVPVHSSEQVRYTKLAATASGGNWAAQPASDLQCIWPTKPNAQT
jgi:hypothetical protein